MKAIPLIASFLILNFSGLTDGHRSEVYHAYVNNRMILIAQAYEALEDYDSGRKTYEKILKTEPGFTYVRDELYPQLLKKISK
ncbi:MAG: hypothetical protein A2X05_09980 [Bacteroidetes bacterium GWE2_41_25]|nr:MAG: hypothetical protein A2X03_07720 [Bacteroidetes bacterium GWA2_40_15]OFX92830.1 MAG: hypothetical protein A2X05_09980 [Bacteroidetes bacterium GWE2_41_25]OFY56982.1 MAG: hypothetical protein A2X04_04080 [Bacteroidetes bacterium GWF2_41_9]HAM11711.1 hypothetical protein [Bacteroidales bacterium]HBH84695.1 hypothetical protein [Bacteroidales bacterium]